MELLIGLIVLAVVGIGAVFWMLKNDTDSDEVLPATYDIESPNAPESPLLGPQEYSRPDAGQEDDSELGPLGKFTSVLNRKKKSTETETARSESKPPSRPISGLLGKLKGGGLKIGKFSLGKKEIEGTDAPEATHFASLKNYFGKESPEQESADEQPENNAHNKANKPGPLPTGTVSITTALAKNRDGAASLSNQEEKSIDKEIELSAEISDLKEKCSHLESMLKEKTADLETAQTSLENELKNHKDFNKVKDILEKDLKEAKDKSRSIQVEVSNAQSEGERYKKRITLLEEKVTRLEKGLLEKEDKIDELVKRLQTFASPTTSAVPPVKEEPVKSSDLKPSASDQISRTVTLAVPSANPPEKPKEQQPPQAETPFKKDVFSPPEPRAQGSHTPPVAESISKLEPTVPQPLKEPEAEGGEPGAPENLSYPEESQPDSEPFLKLQPDVMSGTPPPPPVPQKDKPQPTAMPPSYGPEKILEPKPEEDKQIFKIIDPDNLFGSEESEKK